MCWQVVFALGIGFSSSKPATLPFAARVDALPFVDGITMDILRGCQGMGAAAAIPAAVRCITFLFLDKRDSHIDIIPVGHLGPLVPSLARTIYRVCNFRRRCPSRWRLR